MQKPIPGFSGYFATDDGQVIGRHGRPLTPYLNARGYFVVGAHGDNRKARPWGIHRLVATAFHGPCPEGMECRHLDGDKTHNAASNLAWGTHAVNIGDKIQHGTVAKGARNGNAKLTEDHVKAIRELRDGGMSFPAIAEQFGVSHQLIQYICKRSIWRHVA